MLAFELPGMKLVRLGEDLCWQGCDRDFLESYRRFHVMRDVDRRFVTDGQLPRLCLETQITVAELGVHIDRMRYQWAQAEAFRHHRLARRVGGMDIEYEIARLLRDFVLQLDIEFQSDHR